MPASSRRYPFVGFTQDREVGKEILTVEGLSKTVDGVKVLDDVSFRVERGNKIAFLSDNEIAITTLFEILMENIEPDEGSFNGASAPAARTSRMTIQSFSRAATRIFWSGFRIIIRATTVPRPISGDFWAGCCFRARMFSSP